MADNKKELERAELHRVIWNVANDLRGSVDGWDFKQYVLGMLFYRYISENLTSYINRGEEEAGNKGFNYAELSDEDAEQAREDLVKTKGFFILPSELFVNVRKRAKDDENLNETLEQIFKNIEASAQNNASEDNLKGLFDDVDVNSNKLGATVAQRNEKLIKLLNGIGEMKLGDYQNNTIDAFGDAYEYLMKNFATESGKSKGQFYTPAEVSRSAGQKLRQICSDFRSLPVLRSPPLVIHCSAAILRPGASSPPAKMWRGFLQTHRGSNS